MEYYWANYPCSCLLLQMRAPKSRSAWKAFEEAANEFLRRLAANNPKSGNLGQLVKVLCARKGALRDEKNLTCNHPQN